MHICIIGTGASGWIACTMLKKLKVVKKITIIGSSKIPSIGVGESTTLNFVESFLSKVELKQFVQESDAAVKYGVYYKNWGKKDFLHYFKSNPEFERRDTDMLSWMQTLSNKNPEKHLHDLMGSNLWKFTQNNQVSLDHEEHPHSWHFDAGKFIKYMKDLNLKDEKVSFIDDTIVNAELDEDRVRYIVGESNEKYFADYYVNCCGDNKLNQEVFKEEYVSMSPYLLTNKAIVYPLKYTDKQKQFHPYTVAKTMKNGWRWITPTQSRIGTGYVFSDNHISVDEATH
jgi:tryptophan halogenase